jgi:hypothetical protein
VTVPAGLTGRAAFVARLDELFAAAGVEHVVLHSADDGASLDSDIDVAVTKDDVRVVDLLLRSGELGRLLQRIDHGVPWCRYYVVATGNPARPYRQVDVAGDPWGVSPLGRAIPLALASSAGNGRRPRPAEEALVLLAKRAHKGLRGDDDRDGLVAAYRRDPEALERLLVSEYGSVGSRVGAALRDGTIDADELGDLWRSMSRDRLRPRLLATRVVFSAGRLGARLLRPTGFSVAVVGPDGVGKSTLAAALPEALAGVFWHSRRHHLKPGVLPRPGLLLGRPTADFTAPHSRPPSPPVLSAARLVYLWADAMLGWLPGVALPRRRSSLVVIERGWRDLEVDPARYRLDLPPRLVRALARLLPEPDLVLVLGAPADTVSRRKPELPTREIERQLRAWRSLAAAEPGRYLELDATQTEDEVLRGAVGAIEERLAARQGDLRPIRLALSTLGGLRRGGRRHSLVSIRRQARWIMPGGFGEPGPLGARLYRPFRSRQAAGAIALELVHRVGAFAVGRTLPLAVEDGLAGELSRRLGVRGVELAALATGDAARGQRAVLAVRAGGRTIAFAKVALENGRDLLHERDVLRALAEVELDVLLPPRVIDCFERRGSVVLLLEPLRASLLSDRGLGHTELAALAELRELGTTLAPALGSGAGDPIHGDFAPWNSGVVANGRLALWDWEETRLGSPLEDVFHWRIQRQLRGADETLEQIVADATGPGPVTTAAARRLGIDPASGPEVLRDYLERTLGTAPRAQFRGVAELRERGLALLAEAQS